MYNPYNQNDSVYDNLFSETYLPAEETEIFNLTMGDDNLTKMLIDGLDSNIDFWNQRPWNLEETDKENTNFLLGDQLGEQDGFLKDEKDPDNRMFSSTRAILSYATGQLARPEITPSRGDDIYLKAARNIEAALYQHSADEEVEQKTRAAALNLITRKRGYMKLRWDENAGLNGDVVTEVCNPEDIIIDRHAKFLDNPNIIYHRLRSSVDELCMRFPKKETEIKQAFSIKQSRYTQMSRFVTYFEAWFTYIKDGKPHEGVCWFLTSPDIILDKEPNPNWIYKGSWKKDKEVNLMSHPPKPFVWFNYINTGHYFIDETSLFDQMRPIQNRLNKRIIQFDKNIDFMNGRWFANKNALSQEDAYKMVNKGARTVTLIDSDDMNKAVKVETAQGLPGEVYQSILDSRGEIDQMGGTPNIFKGSAPDGKDTATRDILMKQQAGMLQDDLVRAISKGMERYYKIKLQMMRVYYTDDYWFQVKGGDGKYEFIMLNGDLVDANVKVSVQVDSTLPLDKASIRATAMELWKADNAIDYRTFMEDLGLPNPEIRTERYLRSQLDPVGYLKSVEVQQVNNDAETDIMLLVANKVPEERDEYDEAYINYFNKFLTTNRFAKLQAEKPEAAQRIAAYLMAVQHVMVQSANLQGLMLDDAGLLPPPAPTPMPGAPSSEQNPGAAPAGFAGAAEQALATNSASPPVPTQ